MAVGCGPKCSKILLVIFNLVFWLSGAALLGIALWFRFDPNVFEHLKLVAFDQKDPFLKYAVYILFATGGFVFLVGFLGCCGALRESKCMLGLYIFFLIIIMGAEISAGVLTFLHKNELDKKIGTDLVVKLQSDPLATNSTGPVQFTVFAGLIMYTQYAMNCCAINGPTDYKGLNLTRFDIPVLPTCCKMKADFKSDPRAPDTNEVSNWAKCKEEAKAIIGGTATTDVTTELYATGCKAKLISIVEDKAKILIALGLGIAFLELIGIIFALCLCLNIENEDY